MKKSTKIKIAVGVGVTLLAGGLAYGYFKRNGWREARINKKNTKIKKDVINSVENLSTKADIMKLQSDNLLSSNSTSDIDNLYKLEDSIYRIKEKLIETVKDVSKVQIERYSNDPDFIRKSFKEYSRLDTLEDKVYDKRHELQELERQQKKENKD